MKTSYSVVFDFERDRHLIEQLLGEFLSIGR